jgi:hypothetical protein
VKLIPLSHWFSVVLLTLAALADAPDLLGAKLALDQL